MWFVADCFAVGEVLGVEAGLGDLGGLVSFGDGVRGMFAMVVGKVCMGCWWKVSKIEYGFVVVWCWERERK